MGIGRFTLTARAGEPCHKKPQVLRPDLRRTKYSEAEYDAKKERSLRHLGGFYDSPYVNWISRYQATNRAYSAFTQD